MVKFKQQVKDSFNNNKNICKLFIGLDVTVPEPLPTDHPLLTLENCTIFPHIGSAEMSARYQMAQIAVDNLLNFFSGKPMVHQIKIDDA
jgi:glyoxylate/hydroxypyruvate reductase